MRRVEVRCMEVKDLFPEVPVSDRWDDAVMEVANCCP